MELACHLAHLLEKEALDQRVHVLVGRVLERLASLEPDPHPRQPLVQLPCLPLLEHPRAQESARPRPAPAHVLAPEPAVHVQAQIESSHLRSETALEAASPEMVGSVR